MARPIWSGTLTFGLLNVPVSLMAGERRVDLHFRMLDSRDNAPIRYERVNAETGDEVPWKEIVKAFQYEKNNYVVLEPEDIAAAAPQSREAVEVESFVDASTIPIQYFEKPYYLIPGKKAEKGYVLLRETLRKTGRAGIARVVIRTREYLCAVLPEGDALILFLLRYPQEVIPVDEYQFPSGATSEYRISPQEMQMAEQLITAMAGKWEPESYRDEFRERLTEVIQTRIKAKGGTVTAPEAEHSPASASTNIVDFVSLLEQSLASNKRTPAANNKTEASSAKSSAADTKKPVVAKKAAAKPARKTGVK